MIERLDGIEEPDPELGSARYTGDRGSGTLRAAIIEHIRLERLRQIVKWGMQRHPDGTDRNYDAEANAARRRCDVATETGQTTWLLILEEEFWEAMAEEAPDRLRTELIQVAAVCLAWVEDLDTREEAVNDGSREETA